MKKISLVLVLSLLSFSILPSFAAEKAKVKIGNVTANINGDGENQSVTLSQSGQTVTVGYTYTKTVINGINTSSTTILQVIQFTLEEGEDITNPGTYDFTSTTTIITATKVRGASVTAISTTGVENATPIATGKFKVISYDEATGEMKATLVAKFSPSIVQKGTKQSQSSKPIPINAQIQAILD